VKAKSGGLWLFDLKPLEIGAVEATIAGEPAVSPEHGVVINEEFGEDTRPSTVICITKLGEKAVGSVGTPMHSRCNAPVAS
jgi:hypothetical protein